MSEINYACSVCGGILEHNSVLGDREEIIYIPPCPYCLKQAEGKGSRKGRKLGKTERNISWSKKSW